MDGVLVAGLLLAFGLAFPRGEREDVFPSGAVITIGGWAIHNADDGLDAAGQDALQGILKYSLSVGTFVEPDSPISYNKASTPRNSDGQFMKDIPLRRALRHARSVHTWRTGLDDALFDLLHPESAP